VCNRQSEREAEREAEREREREREGERRRERDRESKRGRARALKRERESEKEGESVGHREREMDLGHLEGGSCATAPSSPHTPHHLVIQWRIGAYRGTSIEPAASDWDSSDLHVSTSKVDGWSLLACRWTTGVPRQ
jgi:hypothetical protein